MISFQWPFKRKTYEGIDNPLYVGDIRVSHEALLSAIVAVTGMNGADFAIITGLDYTPGSPGSYAPGIIYLNGVIYAVNTPFAENNYLNGQSVDTQSQLFDDGNSRNIYTLFNTTISASSGAGSTPQFSKNMNQYRIGLKYFQQSIAALQAATQMEVVTSNTDARTTLGSLYTVKFANDQSIFIQSATVDATITFDFTNAVPGTIVRLQWTWGAGRTLVISTPSGSNIILDSGDITRAAGFTNVMYFAFVGADGAGNNTVSYTISQS